MPWGFFVWGAVLRRVMGTKVVDGRQTADQFPPERVRSARVGVRSRPNGLRSFGRDGGV